MVKPYIIKRKKTHSPEYYKMLDAKIMDFWLDGYEREEIKSILGCNMSRVYKLIPATQKRQPEGLLTREAMMRGSHKLRRALLKYLETRNAEMDKS
jgi:hypothetical protein